MKPFREIGRYRAWRDLIERWPKWKVRFVKLAPSMEKEIMPDEQVILIDDNINPALGVAQAVAHLDLDHHKADDGLLSEDEIAAAAWLAKIRLDSKGLRPPEMADAEDHVEDE